MRRGAAQIAGTVAVAAIVWILLARRGSAPTPESAARESGPTAGAPPTLAARPERVRESAAHEPTPPAEDAAQATPATAPKRNPAGVALRVDLVDALTGEPVAGSWISQDAVQAAIENAARVLQGLQATLLELRAQEGLSPPDPTDPKPAPPPRQAWVSAYLASGETQLLAPGTEGRRVLLVRLPEGRRLWDTEEPFVYDVAADVRRARYVLPVLRSIPLRIVAVGPDGRRAEGVSVAAAAVGGRRVRELSPSEVAGDPVVSLPFLPGEEVRVGLNWTLEPQTPLAVEVLSEEEIPSPEWSGTVPSSPWGEWTAEVRLKGPCGHMGERIEIDFDEPTEGIFSMEPASPKPLRVRVADPEGAPIAHAEVHCGPFEKKTDLDGIAVFDGIPMDTYRLTVGAPGRLSGSREITVPSAGTDPVEVREPKGAVLEVAVVDGEGRPRPFAQVRPGTASFDVQDGVQRIDPYTDARGVRTFARVQPGKTVVRASWAGHSGHADVDLVDGERTNVRVVVQ